MRLGTGTQKVESDLSNLLPGVKILRMDLDTTTGKSGHADILEKFAAGGGDILLGTQMVAKGHHYPNVTVVGVLSADAGLNWHKYFQTGGKSMPRWISASISKSFACAARVDG